MKFSTTAITITLLAAAVVASPLAPQRQARNEARRLAQLSTINILYISQLYTRLLT